jgi:hypothetical protein
MGESNMKIAPKDKKGQRISPRPNKPARVIASHRQRRGFSVGSDVLVILRGLRVSLFWSLRMEFAGRSYHGNKFISQGRNTVIDIFFVELIFSMPRQ